ncbi:MAG: hypothetical protein ABSG16_14650 [Candidatus Acidiferrum sp.]
MWKSVHACARNLRTFVGAELQRGPIILLRISRRVLSESGSSSLGALAVSALKFSFAIEELQRDAGYIAHPIPIPTAKNKNNDHKIYLILSIGRRRLKNPNATEITEAKISIA